MTTNATHTPGPWHFRNADAPSPGMAPSRFIVENCVSTWNRQTPNDDGYLGAWENDAGHYEAIAITTCGTALHPSDANARLIAAAPDLLAACEAMLERFPDSGVSDLSRSAIAKAKGGAA